MTDAEYDAYCAKKLGGRARMRIDPVPRPPKMYEAKYEGRSGMQVHVSAKTRVKAIQWFGTYFGIGVLLGFVFLLVLVLTGAAHAQTQNTSGAPISSRMLLGTNIQTIEQTLIVRCLRQGWALEAQNSNQIVCSHEADIGAQIFLTPNQGMGRSPQWIFVATYTEVPTASGAPSQILITTDIHLQTYTSTGTEGQRAPTSRAARQRADQILEDLETLCSVPCGS